MNNYPLGYRKLWGLVVGGMLGLIVVAILAVQILGDPIQTPPSRILTTQLYEQIQTGDTPTQVDKLFPNPLPENVRISTRMLATSGATEEMVEKIWTEKPIGGTYYHIEFRVQFQNGKVVSKQQKGL